MEAMSTSDGFTVKSRLRDYRVFFVDDYPEAIKKHLGLDDFLLIDQEIMRLYGSSLKKLLSADRVLVIEATEKNKTLEYCAEVIKSLIARNIRKNCSLIALGGGILQDITAFVSMVMFRGVQWLFVPTTLLAQADSCIGSKVSINFEMYKNLLGGFYPPSRVLIDTGFLETLPVGEIKSGIGEILHFYLIADSPLTAALMEQYEELLAAPRKLGRYIQESLSIKKKVIEIDELDTGQRNLFNYGHTFGHAIETLSAYAVNHGQAVTLGMDIANFFSLKLGFIDEKVYAAMRGILKKNLPPFEIAAGNIDRYLQILSKDKKNVGGDLVCILTRGPGAMHKERLPLDGHLRSMLLDYSANYTVFL